ncbi:MAG: hypothetical protein WCJ33_00985, partial [Pseudomonadota bacterium]
KRMEAAGNTAIIDKKNKKPESMEDYFAATRGLHGDKMVPLVAASSIFGSTAGTYLIPFVPGVNYGSSLAYRTVSMQDRNISTPVLNWITGNANTKHYFGVREGIDYLVKYAVNNKDKSPEKFEGLALTILSQIAQPAGVNLNGEHISKFTSKINDIRNEYWQEGGVPKEKQAELTAKLKENFTNKGLDKNLYDIGIDSLQVDFTKIGGMIGGVARFMGAEKQITKLNNEYRTKVKEWRKDWLDVANENEPNIIAKEFAQITKKPVVEPKSIKPEKNPESFEKSAIIRKEQQEFAGAALG